MIPNHMKYTKISNQIRFLFRELNGAWFEDQNRMRTLNFHARPQERLGKYGTKKMVHDDSKSCKKFKAQSL